MTLNDNQLLVSYCGLYCGNCPKLKNGKCSGCATNSKLSWCKVRTCNINQGYKSCADCENPGFENCGKFNNFISKVFSLVFNSDRAKGIKMIQQKGYTGFVNHMKENGKMAMPRK